MLDFMFIYVLLWKILFVTVCLLFILAVGIVLAMAFIFIYVLVLCVYWRIKGQIREIRWAIKAKEQPIKPSVEAVGSDDKALFDLYKKIKRMKESH